MIDARVAELSDAQRMAMITLEAAHASYPHKWMDAYTLRQELRTLNALVRKGLAEHKRELGSQFFPTQGNLYRLSRAALAAMGET